MNHEYPSDPVTLTNGRVISHRLMGKGMFEAIPDDGGDLTDAEWQEYCAIQCTRDGKGDY